MVNGKPPVAQISDLRPGSPESVQAIPMNPFSVVSIAFCC